MAELHNASAESPSDYPLPCPTCDTRQARILRVTTIRHIPGYFQVDMYCTSCDFVWEYSTTTLPDPRRI